VHFTANSEPKAVNLDDIVELPKEKFLEVSLFFIYLILDSKQRNVLILYRCFFPYFPSSYRLVKKSLIFNFGDNSWYICSLILELI